MRQASPLNPKLGIVDDSAGNTYDHVIEIIWESTFSGQYVRMGGRSMGNPGVFPNDESLELGWVRVIYTRVFPY